MAFIDNENGSVTDLTTSRTWKQAPTDRLLWDTAVAEAPENWRIPTLDELQTLLADQKAELADCATAFGEGNLPTDWFWVYKIDPAHQADWLASSRTPADAEKYALEKPGHVAAYFVWMGRLPANRRLEQALCRYVRYA